MFLAQGGEGEVRIVQDKSIKQIVIMKTFIDSDIDRNKAAIERELDIIRGLSHPNVSTLQHVFKDDQGRYGLFEHCGGCNVACPSNQACVAGACQ